MTEKNERLTIITTTDLYSKKVKKKSKILTTKDLPDVLPIQKNEESTLEKAIITKDVKEKKEDEK